eukprot:2533043-Pyramimonas_sp.AAC.1
MSATRCVTHYSRTPTNICVLLGWISSPYTPHNVTVYPHTVTLYPHTVTLYLHTVTISTDTSSVVLLRVRLRQLTRSGIGWARSQVNINTHLATVQADLSEQITFR